MHPPQTPEPPPQPESAAQSQQGWLEQTSLVELLSIWAFFFATPATFLSVLDMPTQTRVLWLTTFLILATIATFLVHLMASSGGTSGNLRSKRQKLFLLPGLSFMLVVIATTAFATHSIEQRLLATAAAPCVAVGDGNALYAPAFERAYEQHGGVEQLGCATNPVTQLQDGYHQNLRGPKGDGVIMATQPDHAFVLAGALHAAYVKIGGPDAGTGSVRIAGYPSSEQIRLGHGWKVELGAGGHWDPSALISKDHGAWYWVQSELWARYNGDLGGPDGRIGYPTGDAVGWNGGVRQQFEHDWLYFKAALGVLTSEEYASGQPPPSTVPNPSKPSQPSLAYKVDSDKGVAHQIAPDGYVEQRFRPQLPAIDQIGAIVGLNTANSPIAPHLLRLELRDQTHALLFSETLPVQDNVDTVATFTPLRVQPGALYTLRVVNASRDVVGIYLNTPTGPGRVAEVSARAYVVGELGKNQGHLDEHGALCGFVQTISP